MKLREPINYIEEIVKEYNRLKEIERKYNELIYNVCNKFPNETRHETALRYIKNAETLSSDASQEVVDQIVKKWSSVLENPCSPDTEAILIESQESPI